MLIKRTVIIFLTSLITACTSSSSINNIDDLRKVTRQTYGQITVTPNDELFSREMLAVIDIVKVGQGQVSDFYTLNEDSSALSKETYPADDILVSTLQQGRDLVVNNAEDSLKIVDDSVVFTFVNEKMFKTGSRIINSNSLSDLERIIDALKSNSDLYLHVRTYDAFNPFNYKRTENAKIITNSQVNALKKIMNQLSPSSYKRISFEAKGNSEIISLGSNNRLRVNQNTKVGIKNFLPINANYSVRVDFIFSKQPFTEIIDSYCENRLKQWYSYQCKDKEAI